MSFCGKWVKHQLYSDSWAKARGNMNLTCNWMHETWQAQGLDKHRNEWRWWGLIWEGRYVQKLLRIINRNGGINISVWDWTDLGNSDSCETGLQQLLPARIQAVQFLHHGWRERKRVWMALCSHSDADRLMGQWCVWHVESCVPNTCFREHSEIHDTASPPPLIQS